MNAQNPFSKVLRAVHDGVLDGWENAVTLLGTAYSAVSYHQLVQYPFKPASELKALYHSDAFAGKTVWQLRGYPTAAPLKPTIAQRTHVASGQLRGYPTAAPLKP